MQASEQSWLLWLSRMRIVVITALLALEIAIVSFTPTNISMRLFVGVIASWFTVAMFLLVLRQLSDEMELQARLHVLTDLAFATALVYVGGGIDSPFNFLYPLVIIVAALLLPPIWSFFVAALSFLGYGAIVELAYFRLIPSYTTTPLDRSTVRATVLVNLVAYLTIAYLATYLVARLRQAREQIAEQRNALDNLRALTENIVQSISSGLVATDNAGRITLVNPAAEALLSCRHDEWIGRDIADLLPGGAPQAPKSELLFDSMCGGEKVFGVSASTLKVEGQGSVGYLYALEDLTDVRRLEREVRVQDRMAAIGRMAAGIAHEIRNPLTSIAGSVIMLRDEVSLDNEQRTLMDIVIRESERLNDIVGDFLAYTRDKDFRFELLDLVPLLRDTIGLLENRPEVKGNNVHVRSEVPDACAYTVADGDRIKQVLWNLCENAMRAMTTGELTVSLAERGDMWAITVSDTGRGMSPQVQERIFEPFQSEFARGAGLGLAIVYQIVQAHEGKISVESERESGTRFRLELKRSEAPEGNAVGQVARG